MVRQYPRAIITGSLRGPRGLPAPDAVPADEAVATYIAADGTEAAQAVDGRIDQKTGTVVADLQAETARATAAEAALAAEVDQTAADVDQKLTPILEVMPNGTIEGRTVFTYGPSRGVGVTASRIHYDRLRTRIRAGAAYNGCTGGYFAADSCAVAYGAIPHVAQHAATDAWTTSNAAGAWVNRAMWGGLVFIWPFGADARDDGRTTRNSTEAKARASAGNALHAFITLVRAETRIESAINANYTLTNGSPNVTGNVASKWYRGMLVQGNGIPANTYVGDLINGGLGGFKLSSSRTSQVDVAATLSGASLITFSPVYTGVWASVTNTAFSGGAAIKTNADAAKSTYVIHLTEARRVQWITHAVDDAEYVAAKGAPYGGTGGAGYSIAVDGGAPIVGTTADEHRFGALDLCHGHKAVDLGVLAAGTHTIEITSVGANKLLIDDGLLVESQTPPTVLLMKEVQLPEAYYAANAATGASWAKTQHYNGIIDTEVAKWPTDESVIAVDVAEYGFDRALHVSGRDGAWAHFNDLGEELVANAILAELNELAPRPGLVWT